MADASPHHIVVVGGGAGGLELATTLGNSLGKSHCRWQAAMPMLSIVR